MLRHSLNKLPRKMGRTYRGKEDGTGLGHEGHLKRMKQMVGDLFRYERIESTFSRCDEARGYAERAIRGHLNNTESEVKAENLDKQETTVEEDSTSNKKT
ncbi:hypothetical protein KUTeg_006459 [Tegillarca granosa]|uniref:Large ribosomal subunit protein bL17m n=1 Tax=Tegillarca granosa TaxID=220873 RepID=A0ABQ9FGM2_TEGGR|nr:hypothetical protein KUTeg_006459 [Tegillarca granosa]